MILVHALTGKSNEQAIGNGCEARKHFIKSHKNLYFDFNLPTNGRSNVVHRNCLSF